MAEPTTALTDWALALLASVLGRRLLAAGAESRRLWGLSFLSLALAALAGGIFHALSPQSWPELRGTLWSVTYAAIGLANALLLAGAARSVLPARFRLPVFILLGLGFATCLVIVLDRRTLGPVVVAGAVTLLLLLAFGLHALARERPEARPLLAGVLVSAAGGAVQALGLAPHPHFNHNDLFHVVQMAGLWLLFRAGLRLADRER